MKQFKDLGLKPVEKGLVGDKIKIERILNREITVHGFHIKDSKFYENKKCLHMQISIGETKHVVFTIATVLIDTIQRVPPDGFPFKTTIVKDNDRYEFT